MPLPQQPLPQLAPSLPAPGMEAGANLELGDGPGQSMSNAVQGSSDAANAAPLKPIPISPPALGPVGFNYLPPGGAQYPHDLSMGESLSPEEQASALAQVDALECQLASLDHSNKADPEVKSCDTLI